jgi:hypothetical protein
VNRDINPPIHVHVHLHNDGVEEKVDALIAFLHREAAIMSDELATLTQEVTETGDAIQSAITLINGLAEQIRDNATDPVALRALAAELDTQSDSLAAAVVANTPATP